MGGMQSSTPGPLRSACENRVISAQLSLRIDDGAGNSGSGNRTGEFTRVLASWIEGDGRISGVAPDGAAGVAVQFSGAPCVPLCGVEN